MLALGLDAGTLALGGEVLATAEAGWTLTALQEGLSSARRRAAGARAARLLVAPDLCRHFVMHAPAGLDSLRELQDLAAVRASQLFGGTPDTWTVAADWRLEGPFTCAVLPSVLNGTLASAAGTAGLALDVESAVLAALSSLTAMAPGFVAWATPTHGVVVHLGGGAVQAVRCLRLPAAADTADRGWATHEADQESLRSGLAPTPLRWLGDLGALPAVRAQETEAAWASRLAAREAR